MTSETESLAKEALILDLFDNYLSAKPSAENLNRFLAAVENCSLEAVQRSVKQFTSGLVERENRDFAPSAEAFAHNVRQWQAALDKRDAPQEELHNGLLEVDYGHGRISMRGLTNDEQDRVMAANGYGPDGKSLAYRPVEEIRQVLQQGDLAAVEGGRSFIVPKLGRV